jgi:hypothetical protein
VCTFRWSEQGTALASAVPGGIQFPETLQSILDEGEWDHGHNFLQVKNSLGKWIDLDVTWDPPLKSYGFKTFPENWDGETSFLGLQKLIQRIDDADIAMKQEWLRKLSPEMQRRRESFLKGLFGWIKSLRL